MPIRKPTGAITIIVMPNLIKSGSPRVSWKIPGSSQDAANRRMTRRPIASCIEKRLLQRLPKAEKKSRLNRTAVMANAGLPNNRIKRWIKGISTNIKAKPINPK